jgi:hypothetical protein
LALEPRSKHDCERSYRRAEEDEEEDEEEVKEEEEDEEEEEIQCQLSAYSQ